MLNFRRHPENILTACTALVLLAVPLFASLAVAPPASSEPQAFITEAGQCNNLETRLGELAQQKSGTAAVRNLAQRLVADHTRLNQELAIVAQQMHATAPKDLDKRGTDLIARLANLQNAAFDKEYLRATVANHAAAIAAFDNMAAIGKPPADAKPPAAPPPTPAIEWARKTVPLLKEHLTLAQNAAQDVSAQQTAAGL